MAIGGSFILGMFCVTRDLLPFRVLLQLQRELRDSSIYQWLCDDDSESDTERTPGSWRLAKTAIGDDGLTAAQREAIARLQTIGYVAGSERGSGAKYVTVHDPDRAYTGLNLYNSGHAQTAILMDMDGKIMHRWSHEYREAFPDADEAAVPHQREFWRRVRLVENGDLFAIYEGWGLIKLDRHSNLIWAYSRNCHHDLDIAADGRIYVLTREAKIVPSVNEEEPILEDFVTILAPDGTVIRSVSVLAAFQSSSYASMLRHTTCAGDILHTNSVELFDGTQAHRSPLFARGNVLISLRTPSVIAILDMDQETIVWALTGQWALQHDPTLLDNGHILLFDNSGHHGMSKVVEVAPFTQRIDWAYYGTPENGFETQTCGTNYRLPNGNTLITESDSGRAFEVTPDLDIVWMFSNPERAGDNDEFVATLFELVRLPPEFPIDWLPPQNDM